MRNIRIPQVFTLIRFYLELQIRIKRIYKRKSILDFLQNAFNLLGYSDSNQEKQDQNLLCYHYTIAQTYIYGIFSMKTSVFVRCWATRTRTKKNRTRICCVTITP